MTADQRFGLIISGIGLVFGALCAVSGLLWRVASATGKTLSEVKANTDDIKDIATALNRHLEWHIDHRGAPRRPR